mmetsp:Transcript_128375/g.411457  ORF Transcript_128375/g.411457 Transcript_128375/m.411457 type:complete len:217 (-) Transcript_128375:635-1285(-)
MRSARNATSKFWCPARSANRHTTSMDCTSWSLFCSKIDSLCKKPRATHKTSSQCRLSSGPKKWQILCATNFFSIATSSAKFLSTSTQSKSRRSCRSSTLRYCCSSLSSFCRCSGVAADPLATISPWCSFNSFRSIVRLLLSYSSTRIVASPHWFEVKQRWNCWKCAKHAKIPVMATASSWLRFPFSRNSRLSTPMSVSCPETGSRNWTSVQSRRIF